jgi:hypothetical protein
MKIKPLKVFKSIYIRSGHQEDGIIIDICWIRMKYMQNQFSNEIIKSTQTINAKG